MKFILGKSKLITLETFMSHGRSRGRPMVYRIHPIGPKNWTRLQALGIWGGWKVNLSLIQFVIALSQDLQLLVCSVSFVCIFWVVLGGCPMKALSKSSI